jgi:hypothetical protein
MENIRYPKQLLAYRPTRRRRTGQPLKIFLDGYNCEAEAGHLLAKSVSGDSSANTATGYGMDNRSSIHGRSRQDRKPAVRGSDPEFPKYETIMLTTTSRRPVIAV